MQELLTQEMGLMNTRHRPFGCVFNKRAGEVAGKKVAIVGDIKHSRVALSNIYALQKLGPR